ncbi:PAS domain-containing sensor histidine kinase [Microbacterium sp. SORGH_AS_0862]|uniref:sensor histidine kinase n=1 Tax=Microbacterium sp. SORGH_AS_0862 TaxID=3041789 RepID=UPI002793BE3E|nr:PAS domain-containing sensor histidine kinase [Microbacterium sp. SORGH_AS_0862]MDQ1203840.1 two-component system phosphate regulon sensor histidine kinase PhoR [Microbacterium sp. SORGH_AS_0862]
MTDFIVDLVARSLLWLQGLVLVGLIACLIVYDVQFGRTLPVVFWIVIALLLAAGWLTAALARRKPRTSVVAATRISNVVVFVALRQELLPQTSLTVFVLAVPLLGMALLPRPWPTVSVLSMVLFVVVPCAITGMWPATLADVFFDYGTFVALVLVIVVAAFGARALRRHAARLSAAHRAREQALARVTDGKALVDAVIGAVPTAIAVYDPEGTLLLANPRAHEVARHEGYELESPTEPVASGVVFAADRTTRVRRGDRLLQAVVDGTELPPTLAWVGPPGHQRAYIRSSSRVARPDGSALGTLVVAEDVTEVLHSEQMRDDFLHTVSHELRTPMTPLIGHLDLLSERVQTTDPGAQERIDIIMRSVDRIMTRVSELLTAADIRVELQLKPTDVAGLIGECVRAARPAAAKRELTIRADVADAAVAMADAARIRQAVSELLANAVKFAVEGTEVLAQWDRVDDEIRIRVSDEGPGMSDVEQHRAFDRFYRAPMAHRDAVQGFGLGLSVVHNIVTAHAGAASLARSAAGGTEVTIRIPAL